LRNCLLLKYTGTSSCCEFARSGCSSGCTFSHIATACSSSSIALHSCLSSSMLVLARAAKSVSLIGLPRNFRFSIQTSLQTIGQLRVFFHPFVDIALPRYINLMSQPLPFHPGL
jgi:hypothetical protein